MNINLKTNNSLSADEFFEQAKEDTGKYAWALDAWTDPPEGYNQTYLLLLILSHRARSRSAIELLNHEIMPPEYQPYKDQLASLRTKAEKALNEQFLKDRENIEQIISDELIPYMDELENLLRDVQRLTQDGYLLDDSEWMEDELRETAHDFLLEFQDMALTKEELDREPFQTVINPELFQKRFAEIEQRFEQYFGYFRVINDIFPVLQDKEYGLDRWWLNLTPDPEEVREDELPEEVMADLRETFQEAGKLKPLDCPESDMAVDYALNEIDPEDISRFREHLLTCRFCLDLVLDMRLADAESREHEREILDLLPRVSEAIFPPQPPGGNGKPPVVPVWIQESQTLAMPQLSADFLSFLEGTKCPYDSIYIEEAGDSKDGIADFNDVVNLDVDKWEGIFRTLPKNIKKQLRESVAPRQGNFCYGFVVITKDYSTEEISKIEILKPDTIKSKVGDSLNKDNNCAFIILGWTLSKHAKLLEQSLDEIKCAVDENRKPDIKNISSPEQKIRWFCYVFK
ncbi:hypothetical protein QUF80_11315 [Desulfococcaceae bacterium HSG8]|nr:hypothetical protein [Desulfococcaceae bacterium HSG8]